MSANVDKDISHNESNMRPGEITRLFNQIGLKDILSECCSRDLVLNHFNCDKPGQAVEAARASLEEFFLKRNIIAHEISFGSSDGPTSIHNDVETFRTIAHGLAQAVDEFQEPSSTAAA